MNALTKLEFKKLVHNRIICLACCIVILYVFVLLFSNISSQNYYIYNESTNETESVKGIKAIKAEKAEIKTNSGFLDEEKIKETIAYHKELNKLNDGVEGNGLSEELYPKWQRYFGIQLLIIMSYSDLNVFDSEIMDRLSEEDSNRFYSNRSKKLAEYLEQNYVNAPFDDADKISIVEAANNLKTPFYYDYSEGWGALLRNSHFFNILILLVLCFCNCLIFTHDFQNGMIFVVRATIHGKSKLAGAKIKASILFSSICFLFFHLIYFAGFTIFYGFDGWNCPIQIEMSYWLSIYNLKFYQAYLLMLFGAYCACIFMTTCTLLFASLFKKAFLTISVIAVFMLSPSFISTKNFSKGLTNFVELFPIKVIDFKYSLTQQYFYNVFGN